MPHQSTQPPTHAAEKNWPRRILLTLAVVIVVLLIGVIVMNQVRKSGGDENQGVAVGEPNPNGYDCSADKYNCADFATQSEAQVAFDFCINEGKGDPWNLDNDDDGRVCEGLSE